MLYESNCINEMEWKTYMYWFDTFKNKTELDLILYVNTEPETCLERINKRNRKEEENKIQLEYLSNCHDKHVAWLENTLTKIIKINGHQTVNAMYNDVNKVITNLISC